MAIKYGNLSIQSKNFNFIKASKAVVFDSDLSAKACRAWIALYNICDNEEYRRRFHFSANTLAGLLNIGVSTAKKLLQELSTRGYLQRAVTGRTVKGGFVYDYLLCADRFGDKSETKAILAEAFRRAEVAEFSEALDKQEENSKVIEFNAIGNEALLAEEKDKAYYESLEATEPQREQYYAKSMKIEPQCEKVKSASLEPINKNNITNKEQYRVVVTTKPKQSFKKEFSMCDIADMEVYHIFEKNGYAGSFSKGNKQQLQFFSMAKVISERHRRKLSEDEVKAVVLFQKSIGSTSEDKGRSFQYSDLVAFVDRVSKDELIKQLNS